MGNGQPSSTQGGNYSKGVFSGVAAWLPFRGGGSSGGSATGDASNSTDGGNAAATAPVNNLDLGAKGPQGGCPVSSSEGGDAPPLPSRGCPVQHDSAAATAATSDPKGLGSIWGYLTGGGVGGSGGGGAGSRDASDASAPATAPGVAASAKYNELNNEYVYGNEVAAGQEMPLSTSRQRSSIPKAEFNPDHQPQVIGG